MKKPHKDEVGSWMDTYGDMVTLLLCFFILMYAISITDQTKWQNLVKSLNPSTVEAVDQGTGIGNDSGIGEGLKGMGVDTPENFDTLYDNLMVEIENNDLSKEIEVKKGEGFTFITFKSNIIFDANSYVLKADAKKVLDDFCRILSSYSSDIQQIQVLGHTAVASKGENNIANDRFLSSNRAASVLVYMQEKNFIEPQKLISMGYGQYRPIADNNTEEGRSANRRVEILITKNDAAQKSLDEYYSEVYK